MMDSFLEELDKLMELFLVRGYPSDFVLAQKDKVWAGRKNIYGPLYNNTYSRNRITSNRDSHTLSVILEYNHQASCWKNINRNWGIIRSDNKMVGVLPDKPSFVYKNAKKLKSTFERLKHHNNAHNKGMLRYGCCKQCPHIPVGDTLDLDIIDKPFKVRRHYKCDSQGVVYIVYCGTSKAHYIGKTECRLKNRIYEHYRDITKKVKTNTLFKHTLPWSDRTTINFTFVYRNRW